MPTDHTCAVSPPNSSPLKHAKSHHQLHRPSTPRPSTPGGRSRAGTPTPSGRPGSSDGEGNKTFTFDHCLWSCREGDVNFAGQEKLYEVLGEEFLKHSLEGYNCCIFAC